MTKQLEEYVGTWPELDKTGILTRSAVCIAGRERCSSHRPGLQTTAMCTLSYDADLCSRIRAPMASLRHERVEEILGSHSMQLLVPLRRRFAVVCWGVCGGWDMTAAGFVCEGGAWKLMFARKWTKCVGRGAPSCLSTRNIAGADYLAAQIS